MVELRPIWGRFSTIAGDGWISLPWATFFAYRQPLAGAAPARPGPAALAVRGDDRLRLGLHYLERAARDRLQLVEAVVVPAAVRRAGDEPVRPVVGVDDPVLLERPGDHKRLPAEVRQVV